MIEPVTQEEKEKDPETEYANMEITQSGTFYQRKIPCDVFKNIEWVHRE